MEIPHIWRNITYNFLSPVIEVDPEEVQCLSRGSANLAAQEVYERYGFKEKMYPRLDWKENGELAGIALGNNCACLGKGLHEARYGFHNIDTPKQALAGIEILVKAYLAPLSQGFPHIHYHNDRYWFELPLPQEAWAQLEAAEVPSENVVSAVHRMTQLYCKRPHVRAQGAVIYDLRFIDGSVERRGDCYIGATANAHSALAGFHAVASIVSTFTE